MTAGNGAARARRHGLSIDVENWYDGNLHRRWTWRPSSPDRRVLVETHDVLDLLAQSGTKATFFVLGRVAAQHPNLVSEIAGQGHEVGCHSFDHVLLREYRPEQLLTDLRRARSLLQDLSGQPVDGYRAPTWSVDRRVPWSVKIIAEAGFSYDSSIFPLRTPFYGEPGLPNRPFWLAVPGGGRLLELPPAVRRFRSVGLPFGGGLYWRALPLGLILALLEGARIPQVTYLHPWELNPIPPPIPPATPWLPHLVLRWGTGGARGKLKRLLERLRFEPLAALSQEFSTRTDLPIIDLAGEPR